MTPPEPKSADAARDELRRTVGLLLSTQQSLIDLRHRRDRELRVLDGIVRFSERVLPGEADSGFWDSVADAATETFECELCVVAELRGDQLSALATRGPRPQSPAELDALRALVEQGLTEGRSILDGEAAARVTVGGEPLALLMIAPIQLPASGARRLLLAAVTTRKNVFFPQFDALTVPGLRMFASHVHVLHEMLHSRHLIAEQLRELDRSHHALEAAHAALESRVAEQQRAEAALRESETRYRHLFEDSADGLALVEADSQQVVDCNAALCRMTNRGRAELIGRTLPDLLAPREADRSDAGAPAEPADRHEGRVLVMQGELRTADQSTLPVEIRVSALEVAQRTVRLCVFNDLSYRRRVEQEQERLRGQLMQSLKMESIGRLAGGVAHDFNNLLTVICGYSELLHGEANLEPHQREQIGEIIDASRRAQALTQQLLMFSRKQVIRPTAADMNRQIEASLRIYRRLIGEDIALTFVPCAEATPILADTQQLDQVLGNLLINARDAFYACVPAATKRDIRITTALVRGAPGLAAEAEFVRLAVEDTGAGMDAKTMAHIFEPFFTTKDVGKGTGLGLATVFGVLQQNHGTIEVKSEPGRGSTFTVYWPLQRQAADEQRATNQQLGSESGDEQVLLVEDDQRVREFAAQGLRSFGYRVVSADSAAQALGMLERGAVQPAILVTDVVMPQMNGRELADRALQLRPGLRVLFVSGYTDDIVAQHGVVREGVALLEKPFSTAALARKIRDLLGAKSAGT